MRLMNFARLHTRSPATVFFALLFFDASCFGIPTSNGFTPRQQKFPAAKPEFASYERSAVAADHETQSTVIKREAKFSNR